MICCFKMMHNEQGFVSGGELVFRPPPTAAD